MGYKRSAMEEWREILAASISRPGELPARLCPDPEGGEAAAARYPMRINPYYLGLIREAGDPIWRQAVACREELLDSPCFLDPLGEEELSPTPGLVWKYPDRALLLVNHTCAMYCRFCTRKRKTGTEAMRSDDQQIGKCLDFLKQNRQIREVLISGGDPLLLSDARIDWILSSLKAIGSIEVIRIGSRVPCTLPQRITAHLAGILKKHHPLYINTHFNHPRELTPEAARACALLADAGIPLGCQTVLLKGINDRAETMTRLLRGLLKMRVRPYYIFQADMSRGTDHLRTPISRGVEIMQKLSGKLSGMAVPSFAVDLPGGGGKVRLGPETRLATSGKHVFTGFSGKEYTYIDPR